MREPLAAPLAAVACGVFAARFAPLPFEHAFVAGALCAGLALLGLRARRDWSGQTACLIGLALAGAALPASISSDDDGRVDVVLADLDLETPTRLSGWVREPPERFEDADRFLLEVETVLDGRPAWGGVRITVNRREGEPPLALGYGQRIEVIARLRRLHGYQNPGGFDRATYLRRQEIYLTGTMRPYAPILPLEGRGGSLPEAWLWAVRETVARRFEALVARSELEDAPAIAVLRSSLLGDRSALSRETETEFQRSGTYHVLVVSGLHVGVLGGSVWWLLSGLAVPRTLVAVATVSCAAAYVLLLASPLPAVRAAWMLGVFVAASLLFRRRRAINALCAVALGFLAVDPEALFEPGFQLSFGAVAAIVGLAVPLLSTWVTPRSQAARDLSNRELDLHLEPADAARRVELRRRYSIFAGATRIPFAVWTTLDRGFWAAVSIVVVSTVLLVALAAPSAMHFQRVATASPAANLWALPLIALLVPCGFLALALNSVPVLQVAAWLAARLIDAARLGAEADLDLRVPQPPGWLAVAAFVSLALCWRAFSRGSRYRWWSAASALATFALILVHPFAPRLDRERLELTSIDVGQGEALLLAAPSDGGEPELLLIDAGGMPSYGSGGRIDFDIGEQVVSPYLWSRSIRRLRALAITHPDSDHLGGGAAILKNFRVEELWLGDDGRDEDYAELLAAARSRGTSVRRFRAGEQATLGRASLRILSPDRPLLEGGNDRSLAMLARFGEQSVLLTGDLEVQGEVRLLRRLERFSGGLGSLSGGLLKVGHHGSQTSTAESLLDRFRPAIAVISAGYENLHGHPNQKVLQRLEDAGAVTLRTDHEGAVTVLTDGRRLTVETYRRNQLSSSSRR